MVGERDPKDGPADAGPDLTSAAGAKEFLARDLLVVAQDGDPDAVRALHEVLAEALRERELTPWLLDLLADMHQSIADGSPADFAMLTKKLTTGRPPTILRDRYITNLIEGQLEVYRMAEREPELFALETYRAPSTEELYRRAAKELGIKSGEVKRVHLKNRPSHPNRRKK